MGGEFAATDDGPGAMGLIEIASICVTGCVPGIVLTMLKIKTALEVVLCAAKPHRNGPVWEPCRLRRLGVR